MEIKADNSYISNMKKLMLVITVRNSFYLTTVLRVSENAEYLKTGACFTILQNTDIFNFPTD